MPSVTVEACPIKDGSEQQLAKDCSKDWEDIKHNTSANGGEPEQEKEEHKPRLEDSGKVDRVTAGCDLRVLAMEANLESHINSDAEVTIKQDHVDERRQ